jgi:spore maturation protein SpmA
MNIVFAILVCGAFLAAGWQQLVSWDSGPATALPMTALTTAMTATAQSAVELAFGMIGTMALFLGLMKIAEQGGMLDMLARAIRPVMVRLFPEIPAEHPAMAAMMMNLSASALGLGNAATPFGIKAMQELDTLNPHRGTATNAMVLFLALNTSGITLLPSNVIALRAAAGSSDPTAILATTLMASLCGTLAAFFMTRLLERFFPLPAPAAGMPLDAPAPGIRSWWRVGLVMAVLLAVVLLAILYGRTVSPWILPTFMTGVLIFGLRRGVRIYEAFVDGAREGFEVAVRIIPYLVAILTAVAMLRASGALDLLVSALAPLTEPLGLPPALLPMALLRPFSGSGSYGILASLLQDPTVGPDSYAGLLASTLQGSSETTFYVLAVYFGAVRIRILRHAILAALTADIVALMASIVACRLMLM